MIEVEDVACPLCGSREADGAFTTRDHEYASTPRDAFAYRRCKTCTVWYMSPRPVPREIGKLYPPDYLNYHTDDEEDGVLAALSVRQISNRIQRTRWRKLLGGIRLPPAPRILDVGCGDGYVLNLIKDVIPGAQTFGVEFDAGAAARAARRHAVVAGDFQDAPLEGQFDLIFASHVIEHVVDPVSFLRRIEALLAPEGTAIIDTPNVDTPLFRLFGRHWGGVHCPRHLTLFSARTLADAAGRAGLRATQMTYLPIQLFWVWSLHSALFDRHRSLADRLFHPQRCINAPSLYYLGLMTLLQVFERVTQLFDGRMGQVRAVMRPQRTR